ncbi:hypothetical protein TNCT_219221 [Trichonephila clavata]|uniref:Secreted protein n=1 Tax=Trichonephila clavata TaxID=2740835 RepID=A0A8X6FNN5_TRICU|nr:hypothetical protein TNCT_219221 [Trichonephila clavata]
MIQIGIVMEQTLIPALGFLMLQCSSLLPSSEVCDQAGEIISIHWFFFPDYIFGSLWPERSMISVMPCCVEYDVVEVSSNRRLL